MVEFKEIEIGDHIFLTPFFSVKDLAMLFGVSPPAVRYWIQQREWLSARYMGFHGYRVDWENLQAFLKEHGSKLKCTAQKDLKQIVPPEYHPKDVTEQRLIERQKLDEQRHGQELYNQYLSWVSQTYHVRKEIAGPDFTYEDLCKIPDGTVAEQSDVKVPEWKGDVDGEKRSTLWRCLSKEYGLSGAWKRRMPRSPTW